MRILSSSPSDTRGHAPAVSLRRAEGRPLVLFAHRCPPGAVVIIFDPDDCREPAACLLRQMLGSRRLKPESPWASYAASNFGRSQRHTTFPRGLFEPN
jgi:hypothetical protein